MVMLIELWRSKHRTIKERACSVLSAPVGMPSFLNPDHKRTVGGILPSPQLPKVQRTVLACNTICSDWSWSGANVSIGQGDVARPYEPAGIRGSRAFVLLKTIDE